jgi:hypothetical protein
VLKSEPATNKFTTRRFPPPWSVEEQSACFVVRNHNGQALANVYIEDGPGRRSAAKLLAKDEARRDRGEYRQAAGPPPKAMNEERTWWSPRSRK